jgi:sulfur carrier protein
MISVIVNGKRDIVEAGTSVGCFLAVKKIDPAVAVVEVNGSIVKRDDFGAVVFNDNDKVEILRFVGGG